MYTIYALIDPRDQSTRYIGMTKEVYSRLRQHSRGEKVNAAKDAWLNALKAEQRVFIMRSLEHVETFEAALEREAAYIKAYLDAGAPLLNIAIAQNYVKSPLPVQQAPLPVQKRKPRKTEEELANEQLVFLLM